MDKDLISGKIGSEGTYDIAFKSGNVVATISYGGEELEAQISLVMKSKAGLEKLKQLIPGQVDDAIISVIEEALGL
jgi:hypothetical protein